MKKNRIYFGDCLDIIKEFPSNSIDLIYLDPPFNSDEKYDMCFPSGTNFTAYNDRWEDGLRSYIPYMYKRIEQLKRILKPTGLFYLHCDHHASHYLKIACDVIFDLDNFRNEIIWAFAGAGHPKKDFPRKHQNILRYTKDFKENYTHNIEYKEYSDASKKRGKRFDGSSLNQKGTPITDYWNDIKPISGLSKINERVGFESQKPIELLERIIKISSNPNDLILDPFMGSGTTLIAAKNLNRNWIGIDLQIEACQLVCRRLKIKYWNIMNFPYTSKNIKTLLTPLEFQRWCINDNLGGVDYGQDRNGIDGHIHNKFSKDLYFEGKVAIQVKFYKITKGEFRKFWASVDSDKSFNQEKIILVGYTSDGSSPLTKGVKDEIYRLKNTKNIETYIFNGYEWLSNSTQIEDFQNKKSQQPKFNYKEIKNKQTTLF